MSTEGHFVALDFNGFMDCEPCTWRAVVVWIRGAWALAAGLLSVWLRSVGRSADVFMGRGGRPPALTQHYCFNSLYKFTTLCGYPVTSCVPRNHSHHYLKACQYLHISFYLTT